MLRFTFGCALAFAAAVSGWSMSVPPPQRALAVPSSPVRLLYQNDLSSTLAAGWLFLPTPVPSSGAADACARFSESLAAVSTGKSKAVSHDLQAQVDYLLLNGEARAGDSWWIAKWQVLVIERPGKASVKAAPQDSLRGVLCTNTAPRTSGNATDSSERWQVSGQGSDVSWTGCVCNGCAVVALVLTVTGEQLPRPLLVSLPRRAVRQSRALQLRHAAL
jgi:hypothetical protein